jgi:hypothetical protein
MSCRIGSVRSTRESKNICRSLLNSCLKRVIFEASGILEKPQNSRRCLEYSRKIRRRESVGMEKIRWIMRAQSKGSMSITGSSRRSVEMVSKENRNEFTEIYGNLWKIRAASGIQVYWIQKFPKFLKKNRPKSFDDMVSYE